jgi:predicted O-linked N-acetylglucosamine transferase (SPINDLY family)
MARTPNIPQRKMPVMKQTLPPSKAVAQLFKQGFLLHQQGNFVQAKKIYEKVLAKQTEYFDALHMLGVIAYQTNNYSLAEELIRKAIKTNPTSPSAFLHRGNALKELNRLDEALESYDKAITIKCDYADAFNNRGNALKELNRLDEALESYDKAITIKPDYADAFINRGNALKELNRLDDALKSFDKAIAINPDSAESFYNRGNALKELNRLDEALKSFDKAIAINPGSLDALYNRGNALQDLQRLDDALESYDKAIALEPDADFLFGKKLHVQMHLCDWSELSNQLHLLESDIIKLSKVIEPFPLLGIIDNPELQFRASTIYAGAEYPTLHVGADFTQRVPDGKIRVGYYSADFRNHVVSELIVELFELHNSDRFEVYGFSFGPSSNDEMRQRISNALFRFIDVSMKSDTEVAQISRSLGIDIAIDLGGFTKDSRAGIFSVRSAPIQVNYLGYPGTIGASYMDYIVADKTLIPQDSQRYYSEKIVYLPHSFQVNDSKRKISDKVFTRQDLGLPDSGFVFCCFNNNYKILPQTFDSWMRLLKSVNGSVLWLYVEQATAKKNLQKEAEVRGVDPNRLVFATRMNGEDHLARHRVADLFLDTLPFNAGATASTALWSGLPILTLIGKSFTARYAASLLNAMNLSELVTETQDQYEARAIELANDPAKLAQIKTKLHLNLQSSPLFNGKLFATHIEAAYEEMYRRHIWGEKLDHIYVNS